MVVIDDGSEANSFGHKHFGCANHYGLKKTGFTGVEPKTDVLGIMKSIDCKVVESPISYQKLAECPVGKNIWYFRGNSQ